MAIQNAIRTTYFIIKTEIAQNPYMGIDSIRVAPTYNRIPL